MTFSLSPLRMGLLSCCAPLGQSFHSIALLQGRGREGYQIADGYRSLIPFSSRCCRQRPRVKRSRHHSSSAGCLSVEVRTRRGNDHKSSLVWAVINFRQSAFISTWLFFFLRLLNLSFFSLSFPSFSPFLFLYPTLAPSGSLLPLQACASL